MDKMVNANPIETASPETCAVWNAVSKMESSTPTKVRWIVAGPAVQAKVVQAPRRGRSTVARENAWMVANADQVVRSARSAARKSIGRDRL